MLVFVINASPDNGDHLLIGIKLMLQDRPVYQVCTVLSSARTPCSRLLMHRASPSPDQSWPSKSPPPEVSAGSRCNSVDESPLSSGPKATLKR